MRVLHISYLCFLSACSECEFCDFLLIYRTVNKEHPESASSQGWLETNAPVMTFVFAWTLHRCLLTEFSTTHFSLRVAFSAKYTHCLREGYDEYGRLFLFKACSVHDTTLSNEIYDERQFLSDHTCSLHYNHRTTINLTI